MIGRKQEIKELNRLYNNDKAELVTIYGRRRVGKTYLIDETFRGGITFRHAGLSPSGLTSSGLLKLQLRNFYNSLISYGMEKHEIPTNWLNAFVLLERFLDAIDDGSRQLVFFDELPWLDTPRSGFISAFELFWNNWACHKNNIYDKNQIIANNSTFIINDKRKQFANECLPIYEKYYPEILEGIKGLANGQRSSYEDFYTFLLSMYCFEFDNHCTCIALRDDNNLLFGRNSDFLVSLEKLNMNCLYQLDKVYAFNGNTTAFIEMEDGINEYGLAIGLTFIYPSIIKPGVNAGMLARFLLEKCKTIDEAITLLITVLIAFMQTLTMIDKTGSIAVIECNAKDINITKYDDTNAFLVATNVFSSNKLKKYNNDFVDSWKAEERYQVACNALDINKEAFSFELLKDILSGKYGFMCQYDRKTNVDTVWSVIYDIKNNKIYRVEGNPKRIAFREDARFNFK